jgi:hypothetical protein
MITEIFFVILGVVVGGLYVLFYTEGETMGGLNDEASST